MLVYISSEQNINLLDNLCKEQEIIINKMTGVYDLGRLVSQQTANFNHLRYFVVDISSLQNNDGEILDAIRAFTAMYPHATVIIVYLDAEQDNKLLLDLKAAGALVVTSRKHSEKELLTALIIPKAVMPSELTQAAITDNPMPQPQTIVKEVVKEVEKIVVKRLKQHVTVSFCGTQSRIGTTTQALHTAKYLSQMGAKVCYMEFCNDGNVLAHHKVYGGILNEQSGYVNYGGIDMFYKCNLPLVVSMGYEFIIMDFGVFNSSKIQNFITSDVRVLVSGVKPIEMAGLICFFEGVDVLDGIHYVFSFAPEGERQSILEQMESLAATTHFSPYAPSYFENTEQDIYKKILGDYLQIETPSIPIPPEEPKKTLLARFRK